LLRADLVLWISGYKVNSMSSKLEDTFGLNASDDPLLKELEERYNFSENPNLNEVAQLALKAYKEQMLDVSNFDPKYRARNIEVAQTFLLLAKDALAKEEDLRLKEEKQNEGKKDSDDESKDKKETFDRDEFLVELKNAGKKA